jgi:PAS domain S-box-containing protein
VGKVPEKTAIKIKTSVDPNANLTRRRREINSLLRKEIQERRKAEKKISLSNLMLKLLGIAADMDEYLGAAVFIIGSISGCANVGIRLSGSSHGDFFAAQLGFESACMEGLQRACAVNDRGEIKLRDFFRKRAKSESGLKYGSFFTGNIRAHLKKSMSHVASDFILKFFKRRFSTCGMAPVLHRGGITAYIVLTDEKQDMLDIHKMRLIEWITPLIGEGIEKFAREAQARQGRELLEKIFLTSNRGIAYMDREFNYLRVNEMYARSTGCTPKNLTGRNHFEVFPYMAYMKMFREVVDRGKTCFIYGKPYEFPGTPVGRTVYRDWTIEPVKKSSGEVEGIILTIIDVTGRKQTEERLMEAQKELLKNKRLSDIGMLAAAVAHELRNPLSVINAAVYNIKKKACNPAIARHIENIEKKVMESSGIIDNMLTYSTIRLPQYSKFGPKELLDECAADAKKRFRGAGARFVKNLGAIKNCRIEADPLQLREVFINILNNAFQAVRGKNAVIWLSAAENNGHFEVEIKDNGVGIDGADLEKIFTPFFTSKAKGAGLGLPVCREIVALHNGKIVVKSGKNKGAAFTVILPVKKTG